VKAERVAKKIVATGFSGFPGCASPQGVYTGALKRKRCVTAIYAWQCGTFNKELDAAAFDRHCTDKIVPQQEISGTSESTKLRK
jgi:hypothetical protein